MKKKQLNVFYGILYFVMIFSFVRTRTLEDFPDILKKIYNYTALFSSLMIIFASVIQMYSFKNLKKILSIIIFFIMYIFITIVTDFNSISSTINCIFIASYAIFVNQKLNTNLNGILKFMAYFYTFITLLNNILILIFPDGFYSSNVSYHKGHLLGDDNAIIYVALPAMILLSIYSYYKYKKITKFTWFNILFCEFIFIKLWAASAVVSFAIFIILLILFSLNISFSPKKIFFGLAIFLAVLFLGLNNEIFNNFITNVLHKDITFTGRTYLWAHAFELISMRPILGYGGYFVAGRSPLFGRLYPVHTTYLQVLVDGGVILFVLFVYMLYSAISKVAKFKKSRYSNILISGLLAMCISFAFEQAGLYHFVIILTLCYNIDLLVKDEGDIDYGY